MTLSPFDHAMRATGIGASEAASIVCDEGALEVWERLVLPEQAKARPPATVAMREGSLLEELVAELYAEARGVAVEGPVPTARHRRWPFILATLDRVVLRPLGRTASGAAIIGNDAPIGILECKRPKWPPRDWGDPLAADPSGEIPRRYLVQAVVQMAVAELPWCDVAALVETEEEVRIYRVERDPELEGLVLESLVRFWTDHVEARVPPPPDGSRAATRYLDRRYPIDRAERRPPTEEERALARELAEVRRARRHIDRLEAELVQRLKSTIGDAEGLEGICTWRAPDRGVTSWKDVALELGATREIIDKHTARPTRRFTLSREIDTEED